MVEESYFLVIIISTLNTCFPLEKGV